MLDEGEHPLDEFGARVEFAAAEDFAGQDREERLHLVQPGSMNRGVVHDKPGMLSKPFLGHLGSV